MVLDPIPVTPNLVEGTIIVASCLYESVWQIRDLGKWLELKLKFRFYITTKCTDDNLCHFTTVIVMGLLGMSHQILLIVRKLIHSHFSGFPWFNAVLEIAIRL